MTEELPVFEVIKNSEDVIDLLNNGTYQFETAGWLFEPQSQRTQARSAEIPERTLDFTVADVGYKVRGPTVVSVVTEIENLSGQWDEKVFFDVNVRGTEGLKWLQVLLGRKI